MTTQYTIIETAELAKVRAIIEQYYGRPEIKDAIAIIDKAKPVEVVGRTFMLAGIQHGAFTQVIGDKELYAIKEPQ